VLRRVDLDTIDWDEFGLRSHLISAHSIAPPYVSDPSTGNKLFGWESARRIGSEDGAKVIDVVPQYPITPRLIVKDGELQ
jgi:hypothetical protein